MAILTAEHVTKAYGKGTRVFTATDDITMSVEVNESLAIVGKSGSGKSTLLHLLALLDTPTSGIISVSESPVTSLSESAVNDLRSTTFGFVFQQFFLNTDQTVIENVILPLKIAGVASNERQSRAMRALQAVELADKAEVRADTLSGGQRQRACIARALVNEPKVIFADEPTGNLDSVTGKAIVDLLFSLHREQEVTLIIVTHDLDLAQRCGRRIILEDGCIVREKAKQ